MYIANGRLEPGNYTSYNLIRRYKAASVVDYLITDMNMLCMVNNMKIHDLSEFSDHCSISFDISLNNLIDICQNDVTYDKIEWEDFNIEELNVLLEDNVTSFDDVTNNLLCSNYDIDTCLEQFSYLIFDIFV